MLQGHASKAHHGLMWEALPALDYLLNGLEFKSTEYGFELSDTPETTQTKQAKKPTKKGKGAAQKPSNDCAATDIVQVSTCINNCWTKLWKYYTLMD